MRITVVMALKAIVVLTLTSALVGQQSRPGLILFNGKIFTSNRKQPYAQALAIRSGRIVSVGNSTEIGSLAGPRTKRIDLGGRTVIQASMMRIYTWQLNQTIMTCR